MNHISSEDAGAWSAGVLQGPAAHALEAHVRSCAACSALLTREARFERSLAKVAPVRAFKPARVAFGSSLLAAASALTIMLWNQAAPMSGGSIDAGVAHRPSLERARHAHAVPVYEDGAQLSADMLSVKHPFAL